MSDCPRFGKIFGGCKFSARYQKGVPDWSPFRKIDRMTSEMLEAMTPSAYLGEACVRCGKFRPFSQPERTTE